MRCLSPVFNARPDAGSTSDLFSSSPSASADGFVAAAFPALRAAIFVGDGWLASHVVYNGLRVIPLAGQPLTIDAAWYTMVPLAELVHHRTSSYYSTSYHILPLLSLTTPLLQDKVHRCGEKLRDEKLAACSKTSTFSNRLSSSLTAFLSKVLAAFSTSSKSASMVRIFSLVFLNCTSKPSASWSSLERRPASPPAPRCERRVLNSYAGTNGRCT